MNNKCCEKCVGTNEPSDEPCWNLNCKCHSQSEGKESAYQKMDRILTEATDKVRDAADSALRSALEPQSWEEEFDIFLEGHQGYSAVVNRVAVKAFIGGLIEKTRTKTKEEVVDYIVANSMHTHQTQDPIVKEGYAVVAESFLNSAREI